MPRVLITAFGPYGPWKENASWLALVELTRSLPGTPTVTTRLYPVDYTTVCEKLRQDLLADYDYALHLGQAPGATDLRLEAIGINIRATATADPDQPKPLVTDGPTAYQTTLPLAKWAELLRRADIPTQVSYHAGTFLCNALMYLTHHFTRQRGLHTQAAFLHLPLAPSQAFANGAQLPSMSSATVAEAIRLILAALPQ
ncbi:MAG: pyroglutamyl-peptidase I [Planctomycetes bacterium]|nr:pyroglutamyl-peptidase I [Planctomycetota bacterium]